MRVRGKDGKEKEMGDGERGTERSAEREWATRDRIAITAHTNKTDEHWPRRIQDITCNVVGAPVGLGAEGQGDKHAAGATRLQSRDVETPGQQMLQRGRMAVSGSDGCQ